MKKNDTHKLITKMKLNSPISEQFKMIRTSIEFAGVDKRYQVILVTSPEAHSGKSTISANLAIVYAQKGKRTLLIDGDMRKPTVHQTFLKSNLKGLSTTLVGEDNIQQALQQTPVEGLTVMTSGPIPPNPNELLGSHRMSLLLKQLKTHFDVIIVDTPPATFVSDAVVLAPKMDGIVMVARSAVTKKEEMHHALEQLKMTRTPIIGAVLNRDNEKIDHKYYYTEEAH